MTDQKPTGVFVRLPLSDEQIKAADQIAKEIAENNTENEWRFARHHFSACDELVIALGTPVQSGELPIAAYEYEIQQMGFWVSREEGYGPSFWGKSHYEEHPDTLHSPDATRNVRALVYHDDYLAQIAARDAEIVRLREVLASRKRENFNAGYLIACCNIVNMHNEEGIASDILAQAGITEAEVKALDLSEYDANALVEIRKASSEDPILKGGAA